ncbi:N-acetyl-gamma-glutamyl-phosphate reductase, partial [Spirulina sp. 06S082]|uniref:N-acetyl-gamma-glutamyl-phosphate reductase n=1 Tax=Spirulina sp. 06S082 TaxID=3110248 RepID=UPI002B206C17
ADTAQGIAAGPDGATVRVMVAGVTGYTGALSAWLVWRHPGLELVRITGRSEQGRRLSDIYPRYEVPLEITDPGIEAFEEAEAGIVAYPHGASAPVVAEMRGMGLSVVDLSADFRLGDLATYERYYGPHGAPELLDGAVYGLPELSREQIRKAGLVAGPGCYPTAALLALAPLAEEGLIEDVVIDAKSGVSGAGRNGGEATSFVGVTENVTPYKPADHRHRPEIIEKLDRLAPSGSGADHLTFVPHLVPVDQGELVSCYVRTSGDLEQAELDRLYSARYDDEPFVNVVSSPPGMRDVRSTNRCHIQPVTGNDRVVVFATIDNLWKGSAGQAIQSLNLMLDMEETAGL